MLEPPTGDQSISLHERRDDGLVGIAFVTGVIDHALACKARSVLGEAAVAVDGEGNGRIDAASLELGAVLHPDVEILPAVPGRGVHEPGAVLIGDMVASE